MQCHDQFLKEDQAGGQRRDAELRHGQDGHHPPAGDIQRPVQANMALHGLR